MKTIFLIMILIALTAIAPISLITVDAYHDDRTSRGGDDPKITVSGNDAYVVWEERDNGQFSDVYFNKITNGSLPEEPINLTKGTSFYPKPQVFVSEKYVYVLWEDRKNSDGDDAVYFTKSNDGGKTFDEPTKLDPTNNERSVYRPRSMQESNDILYVFATHWNKDSNQNDLIFMTSQDHGDTFSEPEILFKSAQWDDFIDFKTNNGTIYVLADDEKNYEEIGNLNLRKILSDGTLSEIIIANDGNTAVTTAELAFSEENIYVTWRAWEQNRWYLAFAKSSDGGDTFEKPVKLNPDTNSIDTVWSEGEHIFAHNDSVYVVWPEEYWDGTNQEFHTWIATSHNFGDDFDMEIFPADDLLNQYGQIFAVQQEENLYFMTMTPKNSPFNDSAMYFTKKTSHDVYSDPIDVLQNLSLTLGQPVIAADQNIHMVTDTRSGTNCILYSSSNDRGNSFSNIVNLSPNINDIECFGLSYDILSPLKQVMSGVDFEDVQCKEDRSIGYILSLRERDGLPVCVTTNSYDKLKDRNWLSKDSHKIFALNTAKKFIESTQRFSDDGVDDSLKLTVSSMRESIPPVVSISGIFNMYSSGYANNTDSFGNNETYYHEIEMVITQNNKVHSAIVDGVWDEISQKFLTPDPMDEFRNNVSTGPTISTILSIGEPVNSRGLIPLTITEVSENVSGTITFWQFQPIGYHGDDRGESWDVLPKDQRIGWVFSDQYNNTDIWDNSVIPQDRFGISADGHGYPMFCDGTQRIHGESGHPSGIPIKPEINTVYTKSGHKAFLPDSSGIYEIHFATLFNTIVEFPENTDVIENETKLCVMEKTREDATHGYYTHLKFKLEDIILAPYPKFGLSEPSMTHVVPNAPLGHTLGDDHQHASLLVKIFGDKFDFSTSNYQIVSPWIDFEVADGNTIHRHSKGIELGFFFDTLNLGLSSGCYIFQDKREFCTNEDYSLKFYINSEKVSDIRDYVVMDDDRILVSYGPENADEIAQQLIELESQELIY